MSLLYAVADDVVVDVANVERPDSCSEARLSNSLRPVETIDEDPVVNDDEIDDVTAVDDEEEDSLKLPLTCLEGEEEVFSGFSMALNLPALLLMLLLLLLLVVLVR